MTGPVQAGDLVAGKYRVERMIGAGGMGIVVAATHEQLEQRVALKYLRSHASADPQIVQRFLREARAAVKIHSEHVARVIDVGTFPDGTPYMVMEYLEGEDLATVIANRGPLPVEEAVGYLLEASEAVAEAHSLGIVHRDLKPANLFLASRPKRKPIVKVLDFGISKMATGAQDAVVTQGNSVVGSPGYMSPEQMMSSSTVDARADVWALGVALYEMLAHRLPFRGDTLPEVVAAILHKAYEPLTVVRDDVPVGVQAALDLALQKDPDARYPSIAELARAIAPFGPPGSHESVERIDRLLGVAHLPLQPSYTQSGTGVRIDTPTFSPTSSQMGTSRGPLWVLVTASLVTGLGGLTAVVIAMRPAKPAAAISPPAMSPAPAASSDPTPGAPASAEIVAEPPPTASSSSPLPAASHTAKVEPRPVASALPSALPAGGPTTSPSTSSSCRITSYFDDDGNKHFKKVCP